MLDFGEVAVAVLAAGQSRRFGSCKLTADLDGRPMALHILETLAQIPFGWRFLVCSKGVAFSTASFTTIENVAPERGQSHSLHLAVRAAEAIAAKALVLVLADMPFVTQGHIEKLLGAGEGIIASSSSTRPMPPALFPRATWPQLLATTGDTGARDLLRQATLVHAPASELHDIDLPTDLPKPQTQ